LPFLARSFFASAAYSAVVAGSFLIPAFLKRSVR
jgi:hypothetical protein